MRYPFRPEGGFTLLELLIVLFIAGMGFSIVAVSMGRSYEKSVVRQEAVLLQAAMRQAREQSVLQRSQFAFAFKENLYWLEKDGSPYGAARKLPEGLKLSGKPIAFMPKGNSTGGAVSLTKEGGGGFSIAVDAISGAAEIKRIEGRI